MKGINRPLAAIFAGILFALAIGVFSQGSAYAHCQIPCGIYDDAARFKMFGEHITTIEKSMKQINELSADPSKNANQLARWVMNKEDHADAFSEIVTKYFLQQRIKTDEKDQKAYQKKVALCHQMLVTSMKMKQTTDLAHIKKMKSLVEEFRVAYYGEE